MVLPLPGGGDEGDGDRADSDIDPSEAEHGRSIYCDAANSGPVRGSSNTAGARFPRRWWEQTGIYWKGAREKAAATEEEAEEAAETELTSSDLESEADTPEGTACGTREEASLGASSSSGAEWSGAED